MRDKIHSNRNSFSPLKQSVRMTVLLDEVDESVMAEPAAPAPVQTSTAVKATRAGQQQTPALKLAEPLTPIVELKRMPSGEYKDSPARRQTAQKSQRKTAAAKKATPLAVVPLNITPLKSAKKKGMSANP